MTRRIKRHRIREIMTPSPITVGPKTGIRKLKALFDEHDVRRPDGRRTMEVDIATAEPLASLAMNTPSPQSSHAPGAPRRPFLAAPVTVGMLLVALVAGAYWVKTGSDRARHPGEESQEASMKAGVDLLYTKNDPAGAAAKFRQVLALNPDHYGATYQLGTALDRTGAPEEARRYWEKLLPMAERAKDDATLATVRARLATPLVRSEDAIQAVMMRAGLDALYARRDPNAAVIEFRKVLARNPGHYGASFQLAVALDQAGKGAEARPLWEKVLERAEGQRDQATMAIARQRLAQTP
jgi:Tfp pilus assembly protein PilF